MSQSSKNSGKKKTAAGKKTKRFIIATAAVVVGIAAFLIIKSAAGGTGAGGQNGGDITITKSQVTETATFIPYKAGHTKMEIVAVKAPDGTIRTAFNTCQVCFDSGRGYYVQQGDELVCQNCGNRFKISQVEKEKNGCNPVPILEDNKKDDGQTITIPESFLKQNASLFLKWKR